MACARVKRDVKRLSKYFEIYKFNRLIALTHRVNYAFFKFALRINT